MQNWVFGRLPASTDWAPAAENPMKKAILLSITVA